MKYHADRKPGGAQNADRDVRPTDAGAKESKNEDGISKKVGLCFERNCCSVAAELT